MARTNRGRVAISQVRDADLQGDGDSAQMFGGGSTASGYVALYDAAGNVIGAQPRGNTTVPQLADQTGGRLINVGNSGKKLEAAFQQIEDELRTQYVASYTPTNPKTDGTYRKVEIQCRQRDEALKVQSRKGYYAIAPED